MYRTIIFHINDIHPLLRGNTEYFNITNCIDYLCKKASNFCYTDFFSANSLTNISELNGSISNLVISSCLCIDNKKIDQQIKETFNTIFIALKNSYPLLMQHKNLRLWILEPVVPQVPQKHEPEVNSFKAGLKALSSIVALELAKKKINVNYIDNCKCSSELFSLINWSENQHAFYVTAQNLVFDEPSMTVKFDTRAND